MAPRCQSGFRGRTPPFLRQLTAPSGGGQYRWRPRIARRQGVGEGHAAIRIRLFVVLEALSVRQTRARERRSRGRSGAARATVLCDGFHRRGRQDHPRSTRSSTPSVSRRSNSTSAASSPSTGTRAHRTGPRLLSREDGGLAPTIRADLRLARAGPRLLLCCATGSPTAAAVSCLLRTSLARLGERRRGARLPSVKQASGHDRAVLSSLVQHRSTPLRGRAPAPASTRQRGAVRLCRACRCRDSSGAAARPADSATFA